MINIAILNKIEVIKIIYILKKFIGIYAELAKVKITSFVAFSTSTGFILYTGNISLNLLFVTIGVFFLASGSSAINQFQERDTDALMSRTRNRPLPSQRISITSTILFSLTLIVSGSLIIFYSSGIIALGLGILALIWYNFVYTPLKKRYSMAVVPGALIGAIPPIIGWVAGGGSIFEKEILILAIFFFIWQIPHFWLLYLLHKDDYEKAGFQVLGNLFSDTQLKRITFLWIIALVFSCALIPLFDLSSNFAIELLILLLGIWLIYKSSFILRSYLDRIIFKKLFIDINIFVLLVVFLLAIDKLILAYL